MTDVVLTQAEADALIAMEKRRADSRVYQFPWNGDKLTIELQSADRQESFLLDVNRQTIDLSKTTVQNRARQIVILARLDLGSRPHRNPDGQEIGCPHLHLYREGFGDKWAIPAPSEVFPNAFDPYLALLDFMAYCRVTDLPNVQRGLFS